MRITRSTHRACALGTTVLLAFVFEECRTNESQLTSCSYGSCSAKPSEFMPVFLRVEVLRIRWQEKSRVFINHR